MQNNMKIFKVMAPLFILALIIAGWNLYPVLAAPSVTYQRTIVPEVNNTYDLGTISTSWKNVYASGTIYGTVSFASTAIFPFGFISTASSSVSAGLQVAGAFNASTTFLTSSSTYLNVNGGNTYIGTLSPSTPAKLIIRGSGGDVFSADSAAGSRLFSLADSGAFTFSGAIRTNGGQIYSDSSGDMLMYTLSADTSWTALANSGNRVGFAVGGPSSGSMSRDYFQIRSRYNVQTADILAVSSSGYIGISSSSPSRRLSVGGSAYIDGSLIVSDVTVTGTISQGDGYTMRSALKEVTMYNITATTTDIFSLKSFPNAVTIRSVQAVLDCPGGCETAPTGFYFNLRHGTNRSASTTATGLFSSNINANSTTTLQSWCPTGTYSSACSVVQTFNDNTLAAGEHLWFVAGAASGTPMNISMTVKYSED